MIMTHFFSGFRFTASQLLFHKPGIDIKIVLPDYQLPIINWQLTIDGWSNQQQCDS
jgi:hypothetical protein